MTTRLLPFVLIVASFLATLPIQAQTCQRLTFSEEPSWATHAEWSTTGSELHITDIRSGQIMAFKRDGRRVPSDLAAEVKYEAAFSREPIVVKRLGDAQILQLTGGRLVRLGGRGSPSARLDLTGVTVRAGERTASLVRIWDWVPAGSDLALLGDLYLDDPSLSETDRRISGVVRLELSDSFEIAAANLLGDHWLFDSPTWRRHRVVLDMLTASEAGQVFFLRLDDAPRIYTNKPGSTELEPLGSLVLGKLGAASPPDIPDVSLRQITLIMAEVESSSLVSGIYWWKGVDSDRGHLYALHREPSKDDLTNWTLIKINPENGEILGDSLLPTKANHLLVAPGDTWALVEKGRYWSYGDQDIPSAYIIDRELVTDFEPVLCEGSKAGSGI